MLHKLLRQFAKKTPLYFGCHVPSTQTGIFIQEETPSAHYPSFYYTSLGDALHSAFENVAHRQLVPNYRMAVAVYDCIPPFAFADIHADTQHHDLIGREYELRRPSLVRGYPLRMYAEDALETLVDRDAPAAERTTLLDRVRTDRQILREPLKIFNELFQDKHLAAIFAFFKRETTRQRAEWIVPLLAKEKGLSELKVQWCLDRLIYLRLVAPCYSPGHAGPAAYMYNYELFNELPGYQFLDHVQA